MQINPIGGGPPPGPQQLGQMPKSTADQSGTVPAGELKPSAASQSSQASSASASVSSSSLSISATQMSSSQRISSLVTSFAPYAADQDLMKLLLLLIALEILSGQDQEGRQGSGLLMFQAESTSSYQSLEISQSETNISYGLSAYQEQSQVIAGSPESGSTGEATTGGDAGRNVDLQA